MIISTVPVAKKYATAYLNVYENELTKKDIDAIFSAYTFLKTNHRFMPLLCVVSFDKTRIMQTFQAFMENFELPNSVNALISLLIKQKRICYLKEVLQDIYCLYKMRKNILDLEIRTADTLSVDDVKAFETFFAQESGSIVESHVSIDSSLIAGVRLQSEFFLWEHSVAGKLRALRHKLIIEG